MQCIVVIILFIVLAVVATIRESSSMMPKVEHFENAVSDIEVRTPMDIYYTNDIKSCDTPGAYKIYDSPKYSDEEYKIDYSFDVEWYRKLQEYHKLLKGQYNATAEENEIILKLQYIIDQYEGFPDGPGSCKITVPKWGVMMPANERIIFGRNLDNNKSRGSPSSWAFAVHENPNVAELKGEDISFATTNDKINKYFKVTAADGKKYVRAVLNNFDPKTARKLYCSETRLYNDYRIVFGLKIDPVTKQVQFIKNNKEVRADDISDYDIIRFFVPFFTDQTTDIKDGQQHILVEPHARTFSITRILRNPCGALTKHMTPSKITINFNKSADVKRVPINMRDSRYFVGKTQDMNESRKEIDGNISRLRYEVDDTYSKFESATIAEQDYAKDVERSKSAYIGTLANIQDTTKQMNDVTEKISQAKDWPTQYSLIQKKKNLEQELAAMNTQLPLYELDLRNKTNAISEKRALTQSAAEMYNQKNADLDYYNRLKKEHSELGTFMQTELIKDIRALVATMSLTVVDDQNALKVRRTLDDKMIVFPDFYWRYLSYDGNLYVVL